MSVPDLSTFIHHGSIEVPHAAGVWVQPFDLWPAQQVVLARMTNARLLLMLKARQIGMTWLTCAYALWRCLSDPYTTVLLFSQGQLEANELIRRIAFLYHTHTDVLPALTTNNITELAWANGSRIKSLPATRKAGRSFTASLVVLDEFAFMQWGQSLLAAVKPTIDGGGQLVILSSADGQGTAFHQFWQAASAGRNGYTPLFLDWRANPNRDDGWRAARMAEGLDTADVLREYPENDIEAFTAAAGQVYDVWSDGPAGGNVTEAAEYIVGAGPIFWALDDGYAGALDPTTGQYTANSSPRVFLLMQEKPDGRLDVFAEHYACHVLEDSHIAHVQALGYPEPDYVAIDSQAAELRGRLHALGYYTQGKPQRIDESIKATRRMLAADANGWRRVRVHPRCIHLRYEMGAYRKNDQGDPIDEHNHGPDALRYFAWTKRLEV